VRVAELWRYPVKSLQGEQLDKVTVTADGLEGDRRWLVMPAACMVAGAAWVGLS
jgi:uncharacterized protein YcbX